MEQGRGRGEFKYGDRCMERLCDEALRSTQACLALLQAAAQAAPGPATPPPVSPSAVTSKSEAEAEAIAGLTPSLEPQTAKANPGVTLSWPSL